MNSTATQDYVIPASEGLASPLAKGGFLALPVCAAIGALVSTPWGVDKMVEHAVGGFFLGIPVAIVCTIIGIAVTSRRLKANWAAHSYEWYRQTFPNNALPRGKVTCRHCGSNQTRTTNLMKQTFMRVHSCGSCGKTLYFSPENI